MVRIWTPTRFHNILCSFQLLPHITDCHWSIFWVLWVFSNLQYFYLVEEKSSSNEEKLLFSFKSGIINGIFNLSWLLCFLILRSCTKISCLRLSLNNHIYICQIVTLKLSRLAGKKKLPPSDRYLTTSVKKWIHSTE